MIFRKPLIFTSWNSCIHTILYHLRIPFALAFSLLGFVLISIWQILIVLTIMRFKSLQKKRHQILDKHTIMLALYMSQMGLWSAQKKIFNKQRMHSEPCYCQVMTSVSSVIRNKNMLSGGRRGRQKNGVFFSAVLRKIIIPKKMYRMWL